jgi:hypothetical protein
MRDEAGSLISPASAGLVQGRVEFDVANAQINPFQVEGVGRIGEQTLTQRQGGKSIAHTARSTTAAKRKRCQRVGQRQTATRGDAQRDDRCQGS